MRLTLLGASTADPSAGVLLTADQVCGQGRVSELTLDEQPVTGTENLEHIGDKVLHTRFESCAPRLDEGESPRADDPVLSGVTDAQATFALPTADEGVNVQLQTTMTQFRDAAASLQGDGRFSAIVLNSAPNDLSQQSTSSMAWAPAAESSLTHISTGRKATFGSTPGRFTSYAVYDGQLNILTETRSFSKLTYTMDGATYVLDGKVVDGKGQITLSKNGAVTATLTADGVDTVVTGVVDPF